MKKLLCTIVAILVVASVLAGCSGNPPPQPANKPAQSVLASFAIVGAAVTLDVTTAQFKEIFNAEMQKRAANPQLIPAGSPAGNSVFAYHISQDPTIHIVGRYEVASEKLTNIVYTFDDKSNTGILNKNLVAWIAAIVRATSPNLTAQEVDSIVGKLKDGHAPVKHKGVFYMVQSDNKKAPWFQIIVRAEK